MSTPNDDLFLWTLNNLPMDVLNLSLQLDLYTNVNQLTTDGYDHPDSILFSRGRLATLRTAVLLFVIENGLPRDKSWLVYWLMVYSRQPFVRQVYVIAYAEILLLWYFPVLLPRSMHVLNLLLDGYMRGSGASYGLVREEAFKTCFSQIITLYVGFTVLERYSVDLGSVMGWFESLLGPVSYWAWAVFPILPGLLAIDERAPINAFTPERDEGLVMAAALWACTKFLPKWIQWCLWPLYSAPDTDNRGMAAKWILCTLLWIWLDTPVVVAYGLYLFANLFPQIEYALRQEGGGPSRILRRERYGWVCFVVMSLLLRFADVGEIDLPLDLHLPGLPLWACCWFIPVISFGIGLLLKKLPGRNPEFKYEPVLGQSQIRLLRVRSGYLSKDRQIHCDMLHVDLTSPPQYTAISYRWGLKEEKPPFIMINGVPFPISRSLHDLILAKRKSRHHVLFWIDALCINQSDTKEKSQQVGLMRRIYEEASSTIGWLGDNPGAKKALDLVQRINQAPDHFFSENTKQDSDSGWKELGELVSNSWFQRVWIIQEIAVAKCPRVRYGKQELEWKELVNALSLIIAHGSASCVPEYFLHSRYIVNALAIENIRICVERVDYLHLEDMLRLGIIFQATLPVDKVFALLGITEERNRALLSLDYSDDIPDLEAWHAKNLVKDLYRTVDIINDLKATIAGSRNSRQSQTIRSSPNGVRYVASLQKDVNRILQELKWLAKERKNMPPKPAKEYDILRPEYSKQTTPASVYSLVAKVAVGRGNSHSIIRHAGIGLDRNKELENLPSWAPDWSSALDTCILPSRIPRSPAESLSQGPRSVGGNAALEKGGEKSQPMGSGAKEVKSGDLISYKSIRDASFGFHSVRGRSFGKIRHLATLSEDVVGNSTDGSNDIIAAARLAFHSQTSNYTKALSLAEQFCHDHYKTREAVEGAFFRTILADVGDDGRTPASEQEVSRARSWIYGMRDGCRVAIAVKEPEIDTDLVQSVRKQICAKYLFVRRMQCSANTKFAHMVQTVILPSFDEYRLQEDDKEPKASSSMESRFKDRHLSFFDDKDAGPLATYGEYVDYTLGRRFAVIDSGHMGLVPRGAQEDDIVVQSGSDRLFLVLRRTKQPKLGRDEATHRQQASRPEEMFRLVGEAYIHDVGNGSDEAGMAEERLFKMW